MAGLQVRVHLVLGIAAPVVVEGIDLAAEMGPGGAWPGRGGGTAALIDVVAVAVDEVEALLGDLAVRRIEALLVGLAPDHPEAGPSGTGGPARRGPGASGGRSLAPRQEAIDVVPVRLQARHLHMDRVPEFRAGKDLAAPHHLGEARVRSDLPGDGSRQGGHAAAGLQGLRRQPGPDHEAVLGRITRRDPELERKVREDGIGPGPPRRNQARCTCGEGEEQATAGRGQGVGHGISAKGG